MKKSIAICSLGVLFLICCGTSYATSVAINPDTGWNGYFAWNDGLGQIDDISLVEYDYDYVETEWSITLASPGYMTLATAYDGYIPGDEFALYVNNVYTPWTSEYNDGSGYYHGEYNSLALAAGTTTLTLYVTALAPGYTSGAGMASFSQVIPEPATICLLGLGALSLVRRKK